MNPFLEWRDLAACTAWTVYHRHHGGWSAEGRGPVTHPPADFRRLRPLFVGDDEQRWVSLRRRALLVEAPGPDACSVVWLDVFEEWAECVFRLLDELPGECHPQAVEALIGPWWARADASRAPGP